MCNGWTALKVLVLIWISAIRQEQSLSRQVEGNKITLCKSDSLALHKSSIGRIPSVEK